jgi:hypothetical protein
MLSKGVRRGDVDEKDERGVINRPNRLVVVDPSDNEYMIRPMFYSSLSRSIYTCMASVR